MASETGEPPAGRARQKGERGRLRRLLPETALGIAGVFFLAGLAAAFTGAVLFAYYEYRLQQTEDRVDTFEASFEDQIKKGVDEIDTERDDAVAQVQSQLDDLEKFAASGETLTTILEKTKPSVWFVVTRDEAGQPSVGSSFVVFSDSKQSFLLTSYNAVRANTEKPGPGITVRKGDEELKAKLQSWDPAHDLALLVIDKPSLPALPWAPTKPPLQIGDRVFVVSGLGASGGAISQGFVADVSADGIQHDAPVGAAFQGGPLVNSKGEVLGLASRAYSPLGFSPEAVFFAVPIRTSCAVVITCPSNNQPTN